MLQTLHYPLRYLKLTGRRRVTGSSWLLSLSFYVQRQQHAVGKGSQCLREQNKLITATLLSVLVVSQISQKSLCFVFPLRRLLATLLDPVDLSTQL